MSEGKPRLSVVVPAYKGTEVLPRSLSALLRSDLPREAWEMIVVDDASPDDTAFVAAQYADTVVRLPVRPSGPAFARNRGFEASRGDIVVFVDADVCVHRETLRRILQIMDDQPDVGAVFGSYDSSPSETSIVSEFRNLLHHYIHQRDAGEAETFWAGCGAIRSEVFEEVGMFDEWHYARPQIEDIELGRRMRGHGHRILLRGDVQGTHLKKWTLKDVMLTDFKHRGVPWTQLLLQEGPGAARKVLNLRPSERICTAMAGLGWLAVMISLFTADPRPLLSVVPIGLVIAFLNRGFYGFIARERGLATALGMLPLHLIYYATNVVSAGIGWLLHVLLGEPQAPVSVVAGVGMDLVVWPPPPSRPRSGVWSGSRAEARQSSAAGPTTGNDVLKPVAATHET